MSIRIRNAQRSWVIMTRKIFRCTNYGLGQKGEYSVRFTGVRMRRADTVNLGYLTHDGWPRVWDMGGGAHSVRHMSGSHNIPKVFRHEELESIIYSSDL